MYLLFSSRSQCEFRTPAIYAALCGTEFPFSIGTECCIFIGTDSQIAFNVRNCF